jgi:hypothetical protein
MASPAQKPTDRRDAFGYSRRGAPLQGKKFRAFEVLQKGGDGDWLGLDEKNRPITIPIDTWFETNMQVIGPTRYGKGVILGTLMDQAIRRGDGLFYVDPKKDHFAPQVMYQACKEAGRKFYYLTLHDEGIGQWAPFAGGTIRDALARLEIAFGLELTGDPGTDY